jgi:hypothetical protein
MSLTKGPITDAMPYMALIKPCQIGRFSKGEVRVIMTKLPAKTPDEPTPAMAL